MGLMTLMSNVRIPQFPAAGAIALRFAPLWPLSLVGARLATRLAERHPALFSRLGEQAMKVFLIDPTDLPFVFVLKPRPARPSLFALRRDEAVVWNARIAGPLAALIGLVHGAYDGDALFFSRDLSIEGDTEAVVALRNAIDNEELDLVREAAALLGPLERLAAGPAQRLAAAIATLSGAPLTRVVGGTVRMTQRRELELVCPAGTPAALRSAVEAGAHAVYCGFNDETNARNFPGLNFSRDEMAEAVRIRPPARRQGADRHQHLSRAPAPSTSGRKAVDDAQRFGADAVILADLGLLDYAAERRQGLRLHLSVQAAAANADAIHLYANAFGVKRVVLPRVLTVQEIAAINREIEVETEVFVFGGLCVMAEGRCSLSSYATGKSPNMNGACSPASHVEYREEGGALVSRLGGFAIHRVGARRARALSDALQGLVPDRRVPGPRLRGSGQPRRGHAHSPACGSRRHGAEDRRPATQPRLYDGGRRRLPRRARRLRRRPPDRRQRAPRPDRGAEDHRRGLSQGLAVRPRGMRNSDRLRQEPSSGPSGHLPPEGEGTRPPSPFGRGKPRSGRVRVSWRDPTPSRARKGTSFGQAL